MQRLATARLSGLGLSKYAARTTNSLAVVVLVRRASDLSRARHMRSPPTPTTSTEPPSRIPKTSDGTHLNSAADNAARETIAAAQPSDEPGSQTGKEEILYERSPSWWIKWVWVLIGMDIIWSGNFAEFIWNRWTRQVSDKKGQGPNDDVEWKPRPMWQRAGLTLLVLAGGTGIALALLLAQARTITRIIRLPRASNQVRVETARNWHGKGRVVDPADITARNGRDDTELIIKLPHSRGEFLLGLDGAYVRGTTGDASQVRSVLAPPF
ncbi:hypothetical protein RhiJN_12140 [Ceratobasidium sp. AG-Ba]|nr:hypothetical protein RhiJN_12140 [Ceratobasidium sp. AG-Ba]